MLPLIFQTIFQLNPMLALISREIFQKFIIAPQTISPD